jgi:isoleucyl-tRNA synthetase
MPFLAEEIYQNLVIFGGNTDGSSVEAAESVHLATWPETNASLINDTLNQDMKLVMRLASLGHSARSQASIKVRQPLAQAAFSVGNLEEVQVIEKYAGLLADELNVKHVTLLGSAEEVEVRHTARSGLVVSAEGPYLAALSTDLTNELILEGLAREFVRRVQAYRKQTGFEIADRIILYVQATDQLNRAIEMHLGTITGETLAVALIHAPPPEEASAVQLEFDNEKVTLGAVRSA